MSTHDRPVTLTELAARVGVLLERVHSLELVVEKIDDQLHALTGDQSGNTRHIDPSEVGTGEDANHDASPPTTPA
jgi:hypothetical protein